MIDTKFTPGPWKPERVYGWGDDICITAPSRDGDKDRPILKMIRAKAYYADFPKREDENGEVWTICSTDAAKKAGNYVPTDEIRNDIELREKADSQLIAAAPELYAALEDAITSMVDANYKDHHTPLIRARLAIAKARG